MEEVTKRSRLFSITDINGNTHYNVSKECFSKGEESLYREALKRTDAWVSMAVAKNQIRVYPTRSILCIDIRDEDVSSDMLTLSGDVDE